MKARQLAALLNTRYIVHDGGKTINIGSPLCSELIAMDKETKRLRYALGWPNKFAKPEPDKDGPFAVWEGMERLIASGEIDDILAGDDEIENPIPVFWQERGEIFESTTDEIGWPRTTREGRLMHDNDSFATREEAVRDAIHWAWYLLNNGREREHALLRDLEEARARIAETDGKRAILEKELPGEYAAFDQHQAERGLRFQAPLSEMDQASKGGAA